MVIGLDCAAPELVFDKYRDELPTFRELYRTGVYGELESCIPAITVPAWSSMMSSKDPGTLGIYGFRNRRDYSYDNMFIATGNYVKEPRVWDILSEAGKHVTLIGVPQTFPIKPVNGTTIASFLTPSLDSGFTWPEELAQKVLSIAPNYQVDVRNFRTPDKDWLLQQIWDMTEARFDVLNYLMETEPWDYFMWVEMGVDRIHHGMWSFMDPGHRRYEPGNKYENSIKDYYKLIDAQLQRMLSKIDDDTIVLVVSDHGGKKMDGGICINEWLWRNGYLALKEAPPEDKFDENGRRILTPFAKVEVDWENTIAWGSGGYYGRVFMNVEGREPQGKVKREDYEKVRDELAERFRAITDPDGKDIGTVVYKPQEIYRKVRGIAPDLIVYWGNLDWRSVGSFGHGGIYTFENDTGPDDANHASNGMFILYDPRQPGGGRKITGKQIMDVAPTILDLMGVKVPADMQGGHLLQT
ncbi:MAG TPA: alkaline phosphatase family protein [Aggregatilineales bacterium]|jgi:predicted AlkP superfamily phosphohydrolase/phosphomutase|nr:alkaline phosphatase family protein [Aggregatilineales bacterium]HPV08681.1 alkaline phosphatase family protein [Aggregatilineales bacterium]HQA67859.1 alkaline phosphatase family protein [Aggregatilineales bacterium]